MSELSLQGFVAECERERLHAVQAIQPSGALVGGLRGDPTIRVASANLVDWTGLDAASLLGQPVQALLPGFPPSPTEIAELDAGPDAWMQPSAEKRLYANLLRGPRGSLDGILSCNAHNWLLELEAGLPPALQQEAYRPVPHRLYRMPYTEADWLRYCQYVTDELRGATCFERVMLYRFRGDDCGEVICESLAADLPPYLGLRYPASDIPQIARTLYIANRHRQIPDITAAPVPILGLGDMAADLTLSDLRAVSPVHLAYLSNMGVTASLSFSILLRGRLWGLIACHHRSPQTLPLPVRERCADMAQVFAMAVSGYLSTRSLLEVGESDQEIARLLDAWRQSDPSRPSVAAARREESETTLGSALLSLVNATGAALVDRNRVVSFGITPDSDAIRAQVEWLTRQGGEPVFATDALSEAYPAAAAWADRASGLLAVRISDVMGGGERTFLWWRPEQPQTVYWAGDPRKSALFDAQGQSLSPRASFERWIETTSGHSEPWTDANRLRAKKFRSLVLRDMSADILRR